VLVFILTWEICKKIFDELSIVLESEEGRNLILQNNPDLVPKCMGRSLTDETLKLRVLQRFDFCSESVSNILKYGREIKIEGMTGTCQYIFFSL
jgi:hypothetical protein